MNSLLLLCLLAGTSTPAPQSGNQAGVHWVGQPGVRVSMREILKRKVVIWPEKKPGKASHHVEEEDEDDRPQNPLSPAVSQWPPVAQPKGPGALGGPPPSPKFGQRTSWLAITKNDTNGTAADTNGDVSYTQVVTVVNRRVRVFDKNGGMTVNLGLLSFFSDAIRDGITVCDARVRFDRLSNRWYMVAMTQHSINNRILLAVSDGPVINAASWFTFYYWTHNDPVHAGYENSYFDYPSLGIDAKAVYIGGRVKRASDFFVVGTNLTVINKSGLVNGGSLSGTTFYDFLDPNTRVGMKNPMVADNDDPNANEAYALSVDLSMFGRLVLRKIQDPGGTPTIGPNIFITVPTTSVPKNALTLGSTKRIDSVDDYLMAMKVAYNANDGTRTLWTAHAINVGPDGVAVPYNTSNGRAAHRWYQIKDLQTAAPALLQSGTVWDSKSSDWTYFNIPTLAVNRQGHVLLGGSYSNALEYPGVVSTYRLAGDPLGTMRPPVRAQQGLAVYDFGTDNPMRWGDYSHTTIDPTDGMTAWTFQQYSASQNNWGIRVIKFFAPPPATVAQLTPAKIGQGETKTIVVSGTSENGSGFFDPGDTFPSRLAAALSGTGLTVQAIKYLNPTSIELTVAATGAAALGQRDLTITNPDGQFVVSPSALEVVVSAPALASLTLPANIVSGQSATGTVTLSENAPAGGATVTLLSSNAKLVVPASIVVSAGSKTKDFTMTTTAVAAPLQVTVTAKYLGAEKTATTQLRAPELAKLTLSKTSIMGGSTARVKLTVELDRAAPAAIDVVLASDSPLITLPATLRVPSGALAVSTLFAAQATSDPKTVILKATWQGVERSASIVVQPPAPSGLNISPLTFIGGSSTQVVGTVSLVQAAPAGGVKVALASNSLLALTPQSVTVAAGQTTATFPVTHSSTAVQRTPTISATSGGKTVKKQITVNPPTLVSVSIDPKFLTGGVGESLSGTVVLNAPAVGTAMKVVLTKSSSAITLTPTQVIVPAGSTTGTFTLTAPSGVATDQVVTLTGTYGGVSKTALVTVRGPRLASLAVSPKTVVGGSSTAVTLTVTITIPAPAGGCVVQLASTASSAASLPPTITVPAGATTATVGVSHFAVATDTTATLSGSLNGSSRIANLTVKH